MKKINTSILTTTDWRKILRRNNQRTYVIIFLFILIYAAIGCLIDLYIYSNQYINVSLKYLFIALVTLKLFPLVTLIMFVVATLSLLVTYALHDKLMLLGTNYYVITEKSARNNAEKMLFNIVEEMRIAAGLHYTPKIYIINAPYMNAFASGYSEKSAMIVMTQGLMEKLNRDEVQAVVAHELSHIRHLDIKLTLTASVLANISIMVLDIFFYNAIFKSSRSQNKSRQTLATIIILLRYLLPLISILLLFYLNRTRELMADAGSVELTRNNQPLAHALIKINSDYKENKSIYQQQLNQTKHENVRREAYLFDPHQAGISTPSSLSDLFSTHPSLAARLHSLGIQYKE